MKERLKKIIPTLLFEQPGYFKSSTKKIAKLKNKFKGERCFIVGNGPSLNQIDLTKLAGEYSFAANSIFLKTKENGYKPTFYTVEDSQVIKDNVKEINNLKCQYNFFPAEKKSLFKGSEQNYFLNFNYAFYIENSDYFEIPRFSQNVAKEVYCGQSVTIVNLQLAYYLGFTEVYLIGMDFKYSIPESSIVTGNLIENTEDDVNHFHNEYFGKGKKWYDPKLHNVLKSYKLCKLMYELDDRKIINATVGGELSVFERMDFEEVIKKK